MRTASILLPLTLLAAAVAAPAHAETKIGAVSMQTLTRDAPQVRDADQKLKAEFGQRENDLKAEGKKFDDDYNRFRREGDTMSPTQRTSAQNDLNTRQTTLQMKQREFQEAAQNRQEQLRRDVWQKIQEAVKAVAEEGKYDLIVAEPAYATDAVDLTDDVLKKLATMGNIEEPASDDAAKKKKKKAK